MNFQIRVATEADSPILLDLYADMDNTTVLPLATWRSFFVIIFYANKGNVLCGKPQRVSMLKMGDKSRAFVQKTMELTGKTKPRLSAPLL